MNNNNGRRWSFQSLNDHLRPLLLFTGVVSVPETTPVNNNNGRGGLGTETTPVNNNNGRGGVGTETTPVNNNNGRGGVGTETTHHREQ